MAKIDKFFSMMIGRGASDLHLQEGQPPRVRIHGDIEAIEDHALEHREISDLLSEAAGQTRWNSFIEHGDIDFAYQMDNDFRFRSNYMKQVHGIGAVFRLIPTEILTLEQLGIPPVVKNFTRLRGGIVLVTGPTGSGKSTTLAALVDYMNKHVAKHIVTIEEPIEFVHKNKACIITQREVPVETPSFRAGLKAALREDPDVIMVGEMRDLETISLALTAAETGILVFGTLHTNNARKTVDRIIDVFPADQQPRIRAMLGVSLRGVIAQLLLKRSDGKGRLAVNEILVSTSAVAAIIREGKTEKLVDVLLSGRSEGMQLMDDSILKCLKEGRVTPVEAYMKAIDKQRFEEFLPRDATFPLGK